MTGARRCVGCGGLVPDVDGPTHAYMRASPGCWSLYAELAVRLRGHDHVDCYAVQHPDGADVERRQRSSVAVHLVALCLLLEHAVPENRLAALRGRASATVLPALGREDWPYLEPPGNRGDVTAADVNADPSKYTSWPRAAWSAWHEHHGCVRGWAETLVAAW